jgi:OOP family OmpA-OmpF porin
MRRVILLCGAAASAALSASAADARAPYVTLSGGAYLQQKLNYNFIGIDNFFSTKYKTGYDVSGALGYDFEGIRVELEVGYKRASLGQFGFDIGGVPQATRRGSDVSGNSHVFTGMLNGYYDFSQRRFQPYIGGGLGIANVTSDHVGYAGYGTDGIFLDKSAAAFAFQGMAGVRAKLGEHVMVGAGYRYFEAPSVRLAQFNTTVKTRLRSSSVLGTLTYKFGTPYSETPLVAVPPPDAAAVLVATPPPPPVETGFGITFAVGATTLSNEARADLDQAAAAFAKVGHASVMISSSAQDTGPALYDERLSTRRAIRTRDYLVAHGTPRDAITIQTFDSKNAAAPHPTDGRGAIDITFGPGSGQ